MSKDPRRRKSSKKQNIQDSSIIDSQLQLAQASKSNVNNIQGSRNLVIQLQQFITVIGQKAPFLKPSPRCRPGWKDYSFMLTASLLVVMIFITPARWMGSFENSELSAYDLLMKTQAIKGADDRIKIILATTQDVDKLREASEKATGRKEETVKLSDYTLDKLFEKLNSYKPRTIGLVQVHPSSISSQYNHFSGIFQKKNTILICASQSKEAGQPEYKSPDEAPEGQVGFADVREDNDDIIRRIILIQELNDPKICKSNRVQAFSLRIVANFLGLKMKESASSLPNPEQNENGSIVVGNAKFMELRPHDGGYNRLDLGQDFQTILNYPPYRNHGDIAETISIMEVLDGKVSKDTFKDRIVIIGSDDNKTFVNTPFSTKLPSVYFYALVVKFLLQASERNHLLVKFWGWWLDIFWVFIWSFVAALLVFSSRIPSIFGIIEMCFFSFLSSILLGTLCWQALVSFGFWIPFFPAIIGMFFTALATILYRTLKFTQLREN
jgi:CHASE2 domain-containing sensor protein